MKVLARTRKQEIIPEEQTRAVALPANMQKTSEFVAGELAESSRRIYKSDVAYFQQWLQDVGRTWERVSDFDLQAYRNMLTQKYAKRTAKRMFSIVVRMYRVAYAKGYIPVDPTVIVRGVKMPDEESPYVTLTKAEAKSLIASIDQNTIQGRRDALMIMLMIRTGIRREEVSGLAQKDIMLDQGHHILMIRHGKGDKQRIAKLPVDVYLMMKDYLDRLPEEARGPEKAIFCTCRKTGKSEKYQGMSARSIGHTIRKRVDAWGGNDLVKPHGLRATFATLAFKAEVPLQKVQMAMGHSDPRTTQNYQHKSVNLESNAVDGIVWSVDD